jgi:hypothetical protein
MLDLDAMIEPLRTPLVLGLATTLCVALAAIALFLQVRVGKSSKDFFASLGPDDRPLNSADELLAGLRFGERIRGPMTAAQLAYFKSGLHLSISDPELLARAVAVQRLANLHAVAVTAFVLSMFAVLALRYKG